MRLGIAQSCCQFWDTRKFSQHHSGSIADLSCLLQGMEIGYKRAERLGVAQSEYGDEQAEPSDGADGRCAIFMGPNYCGMLHAGY